MVFAGQLVPHAARVHCDLARRAGEHSGRSQRRVFATGPNPKSGTGEHWFLGNGMVHGARFGEMPRSGTTRDVRWFEIEPCYVFHQVNAWDNDSVITL